VNNVKTWYKKTIIADFIVRAGAPDMATGMSSGLSEEVGEKIKSIPGVLNIDAVRLAKAEAEGQEILLITRGFDDPELFEFDLVAGDPREVRDKLKAGEVVLGSVPAQRLNKKPGDTLKLNGDQGEKTFTIAAIANDYQAGGLTMYMDSSVATRELGIGGADAYTVKAEKDKIPEVRKALDEMSEDFGDLLVQSASDIRNEIDKMMAAVDGGLWGLVVLVLMVAMFGVANTLTMTVIEQTFELGLLRIVAATRAQVRKLIFAQALVMGILALVPAIVAGLAIAYLIHLATMTVIGHPVAFELHPWMLATALVGGLAVIFLAAWPPAERAARVELQATLKLR
jgi:putative ABC transport system permease protein